MIGEGQQTGLSGHVGLGNLVPNKGIEIQQGIGSQNKKHRQRHRTGRVGMDEGSLDLFQGNGRPTAAGGVQDPPEVGQPQR